MLRAARAALVLGRPLEGRAILDAFPATNAEHALHHLVLAAAIDEAEGHDAAAARRYTVAAAAVGEARLRGILLTRAAAALERAGTHDSAAALYLAAAAALPAAAAWLGVRAARVIDSAALADSLLGAAPPAARTLVQRVHAARRIRAGDSTGALAALAAAGALVDAAGLALAVGDSATARTLAYQGMLRSDTAEVRAALELIRGALPPSHPDEHLQVARAAARTGDPRLAVLEAERAVAGGDSTAATLLSLGGWLEQTGRRREALSVYARAGDAGAFARARALLRLGRRSAASEAFERFVTEHPDHASTPLAAYLIADIAGSDEALRTVFTRWPDHAYGSRARVRLATRMVRRGDMTDAIPLYQEEIARDGDNRRHARYMVARLRMARGERDVGVAALSALSRDDSLGYYGTVARQDAGLRDPVFPVPPPRVRSSRVERATALLAWLDAAGLAEEARLLVDDLMNRTWEDPDEVLDLSEALADIGRVPEGIRLAWRAAERLTLNHPRVVRAVFPWPRRALIEREAREFGIDPHLLAGLIRQESSFKATARSRAGALGFMQLMPATARWVADRLGVPWSETMFGIPEANVHVGAAHLAGLLRRYDGNVVFAVAAYNAGGTPVGRWLRYPEARDPTLFVERIPYVETRGYVRTVIRNRALYRALYPLSE